MSRNATRSRGFTLVELTVALVVSGFVLLSARALYESVARTLTGLAQATIAADESGNGDRLLRSLVRNMDVGIDSLHQFSANAGEARFASWCDVPAGWLEPCRVDLALSEQASGVTALIANLSTGGVARVWAAPRPAMLRYLHDTDEEMTWLSSWTEGMGTPLAVAVVSGGDTTILRVGDRVP